MNDEYQDRVTAAVIQAILDASLIDIDEKPTAYIATAEVMEALVNVMASLIEGAPNCQTPKQIKEQSSAFARKLSLRIRDVRRIIAETGIRPFDITVSTLN